MKLYFILDGEPVEIKKSSELKVSLSKRREKELRGAGKGIRGSLSFAIAPYREFKDKIKAQIKRSK